MKPKLIVADDSPEMRALVCATLWRDYPEMVEASDGRQLLWQLMRASILSGTAPAQMIAVVDVCMPSYSGLDVLDAWTDGSGNLPIVVITSYPDDKVRRRVLKLGAILLPKPFSRTSLRDAVQRAAQRLKEAARPAPKQAP